MADVCISYDEKSAENVARQICETLEGSGISCWYVGRDMEKGLLRGAITQAIRDCRVFLLVLSEKAMKSAYVKAEIALAVRGFDDNRKRELVAFRVDDVSAEAQLNAFLDELRARDDFPSDIAPFRIADGCPPGIARIAELRNQVREILYPPNIGWIGDVITKDGKQYYLSLNDKNALIPVPIAATNKRKISQRRLTKSQAPTTK